MIYVNLFVILLHQHYQLLNMKKYLYTVLLTFLCVAYANGEEGAFKANKSEDSPLGYICEGTVWELATLSEFTIDSEGHLHYDVIYVKEWIEGTEEIGGHTYMKVWKANSRNDYQFKRTYYIRTEQEKVYQLNPENLEEHLLFDFSLTQEQEIDLTFLFDGFIGNMGQATCVSENDELYNEQIFKTIDIKFSIEDEDPIVSELLPTFKWIKGIGSESGILDNYLSPELGGSTLLRVLHNGEVVYRPAASSAVEQIAIESTSAKEGKRYHIDGREFNDGDTGICIQNGKKTIIR